MLSNFKLLRRKVEIIVIEMTNDWRLRILNNTWKLTVNLTAYYVTGKLEKYKKNSIKGQ